MWKGARTPAPCPFDALKLLFHAASLAGFEEHKGSKWSLATQEAHTPTLLPEPQEAEIAGRAAPLSFVDPRFCPALKLGNLSYRLHSLALSLPDQENDLEDQAQRHLTSSLPFPSTNEDA